MAAIKDRKAKAEAKVARAEKALESAIKELTDVAAAERVFAEITGESVDPKPTEGNVSARDVTITRLIPAERAEALSPAELLPIYIAETHDTIGLEAFRTAVWRLLKKVIPGEAKTWVVKADGGKYWREPFPTPDDFEELLDEEDADPWA